MTSLAPQSAREDRPIPNDASPSFLPLFDAMSRDQRARHFATRSNAHYFPVPDAEETRPERIDAILGNRFDFNGEGHVLSDPIDWLRNPSLDVEWHILLHKFYYAVGLGMRFTETGDARYRRAWMQLVSGWIDTTPEGFIATDVTGRRVQNWIYAYHYFGPTLGAAAADVAFLEKFLGSLHGQVEYLCAHLTPARNHRTLELYAIFLAGVAFPEFTRAGAWREFALAEIVKNVETDLLPDGVQCELSTDYHHLVLKNYLCIRRLATLNGIAVPAGMDQRLVQALEFSLFVHKPDGIVPSLSDGDARSFLDLLRQGHELYGREDMRYVATQGREGTPPRKLAQGFPDSGYYILRGGWGDDRRAYADEHYLVFDCGPLGAGNHGHLDCLNFELAAFGHSLVVDPGRYTYSEAGDVNWRIRFRGTSFHNTVTVDGRNQTRFEPREVKDASRHRTGTVRHRVTGPAPDAQLQSFVSRRGFGLVHGRAASHEYDAHHDRRIAFVFGDYWIVNDTLVAGEEHRYDCWLHLSERAEGRVSIDRRWGTIHVRSPGLAIAHEDRGGVDVGIEPGQVSYRYGVRHPAPVVRLTQRGTVSRFNTVLYPHRDEAPALVVREFHVSASGPDAERAAGNACALRVQVGTGLDSVTDHLFFAEAADCDWHFGGHVFRGTFLALRRDASGEIIDLHAARGSRLRDRRGAVVWEGLES